MLAEEQVPIIAFVWRPGEISAPVSEMAQRTGSRAIFDFSTMGAEALHSFLRTADPAGHVSDIRISTSALMNPSVGQLLKETGARNLWVECQSQFFAGDPSAFQRRLRTLSEDYRCFPIVGDVPLLAAMVKDGSGIGCIVLKGCEAAGFVSGETTLVLYSVAKEMLHAYAKSLDVLIWGGVSTPEAAAAFLSTGAAGIVFESVHWLTDLVVMDDRQRQQLARLRMDSTALVGLDLQVPCRLFNKGNSLAFKKIQAFEDSLCASEITDESRRAFVGQVQASALHPLDSHFTQSEVIPLGVEAAFAASFAERFGTGTEKAVKAFMGEMLNLCGTAEAKKYCFLNSAVAREMGIKYPFIQGAMSSITDIPEFASEIADAGGLPTIALGLMDAQARDRRLGRLPEIMGGRPYAVNVVSLAENLFRETHLDWIKQHRPPFVWIAGGDLSPIRELLQCGIGVVYIAPDEALLKLALEAGVRYVVCEGYEAGGHVGQHSTLTLAQMVLDLKRRQPSLFQDCRVILAGGIFNRETAFMAGLLGADAIQMGTAYLATQEIVETGALAALYQRMIVESPPGGTVVSGQSTGLRVRSLRTPRVTAILALEREFAAGHQDEQSFREKMEEMTAGSLFAAARGVDRRSGRPLDEQACLERGQFMSGSCAGLINKVQKLESFHRELAEGPLLLHQPFATSTAKTAAPSPDAPLPAETPTPGVGRRPKGVARLRDDRDRVAITGMSVLNALGKSPEEVWEASLAMKSGVTLVPSSRWNHDRFYDPRPRVTDKTYCQVGAFVDFHVSRNELGIPPQDFRTMTSATRITMWLAQRAIRASGILESGIPRERIAVLISQNSGEAAGTLTDMIIREYVHEILSAIKRAIPLTPDQESAIEREVKSGRIAPDDTTLLGRLNCTAPGFICNRYGFMGPSYSVSAACATSLVALYSALQMIRNGIIDAAIVGGGEDNLTHLHFLEFSALGALYGLSGRPRPPHEASCPFDAERDGMVLGEGGGMIVIERESLARDRGAPVHAVITGMGASNDHLGMVEPSSVTQEIAMRASFRGLPYGPEAVDLVECHGTSTRQGDAEEVRTLRAVYDHSKTTVITSLKSQIGHTLGSSGLNDLIRGVMAMKAGVFPPTLNYRHPDPEIDLEGSGFRVASEPFDWQRRAGLPRRLQVNAFGFGGSNYVVQVEQALDGEDTILVSTGREARLAAETADGFAALQGVSFFRTEMAGRTFRMAVVAPSAEEALTVIERSASLAEAAVASSKAARSLALQGLFLSPEDPPVPPLALVFPGQGAHYAGMGQALYESFPIIKEWMDRAAAAADFDLLHLLFHDREENLQKTRWQQPALFTVEYAMARYLISLGIHPVAMAGHSLGELTALCLAGVYSPEDGFGIVNKRALCMDKAAAGHLDPGTMAATDAPMDLLRKMLHGRKDVHIGNINAPNQVVLSGHTEAIKNLGQDLKHLSYRFTLLRVSMAFHSPIMRVIHDELEAYVASIPFHSPQVPVISNTTMAPYPSDPGEIRRILMAHLESTVHWMNNVQTLWNGYGVRLFVEVGPGDILSNLIADTLHEPLCLQTCLPTAESHTYQTALAQLFVHGHLQVRGEPRFVSLPAFRKAPESHRHAPAGERSPRPLDRPPAAPALAEEPERQDHLEAIIRIIMDATGFNRDEIQLDMDLRRDLSIRSSRLPVIMDAAERHFGITIELEDFIHVRTVRDIGQRISAIVARQEGVGERPAAKAADPGAAPAGIPEPSADEARLKRLVFNLAPVEPTASMPLELSPGEGVLLLSPDQDDALAKSAGDLLRQDYGIDTFPLPFMPEHLGPGEEGHDILTAAGVTTISERISGLASLAGLVITLPQDGLERLAGMADVSRLLTGLFQLLKSFLQSPTRKFVVLIHAREDTDTLGRLLTEGLLGLFLSAAQEHPAVQFRTLEIDQDADLPLALRAALDKGCAAVELIHREGKFFTSQGHLAPSVFGDPPSLKLNPGDVVVMSGGATGISAHLARSLVPFAPRLVFLGRTQVDPCTHPLEPHSEPSSSASAPDKSRTREIAQTLADLHASGIEATYLACDVTDPEAVRVALGEVAGRYGRIDGIIHGAGVLRDAFLDQMTPEDFSLVTDVKFLGAWNLFSVAEGAGLRFFVGLSSVAAIQGNPGQTNYAAANRMMSALLRYLRRKNGAIRFKALMLPPVEGTGMAEDPEVRDLLRRRGVAYVHVHELAGLFCRELFVAPADDDWVMFIRTLPAVKTAPIGDISHPALSGQLDGGPMAFSPRDFPMIDGLSCLDLRREHLEASRSFSRQNDLWIADHRPLKSLAHPLVSASMMLETFMESARILYPHLQVRGVRQVRFMDMISCPPEVPRSSRISCQRAAADPREVVCEASLSVKEISPTGRLADRFIPHCTGQVLLGGGRGELAEWFQDFPVRPDELWTQPVNHEKVLKWYEDRTGLEGRYRVLEVIDGAGPGLIRGRTIYRETCDFAHLHASRYQYSPYLFEALMQLAGFHMLAIDPQDRRLVLPTEIGEMQFLRQCRPGEEITLEARLRVQDEESLAWDARGIDDQGRTIMQVRTMRMHWVSA
jgi:malonyl CoA-acyl carrier protein transacylase